MKRLQELSLCLIYQRCCYFQDIQTNVEKSMQSLLAAGSAIGQRMLGMITRSPRVLLSPQQPVVARPTHLHHNENFPDFNNCDCHFGKSGREREDWSDRGCYFRRWRPPALHFGPGELRGPCCPLGDFATVRQVRSQSDHSEITDRSIWILGRIRNLGWYFSY